MFPRSTSLWRVESILLVVVAYLVLAANETWWTALSAGRSWSGSGTWLLAGASFVALVALHFLLLALFANRWTVKPLLIAMAIGAAAAQYYMQSYSVVMDKTMLQNVLQTDLHETRDLVSLAMIGRVVLYSLAPVAFLLWVRIDRRSWPNALGIRLLCLLAAVAVSACALWPVSRDLTSMMRNQRDLRYTITPGNLIVALAENLTSSMRGTKGPRQVVGGDAHIAASSPLGGKPRVLVLVLGETARAANFSLLSYHRETNPELAKLDVAAFANVTACGTSTAISVPCMFSVYGRENYDEQRIIRSETLLDVVARAGVEVRWRDNQSGCKGVCNGPQIDYRKLDSRFAPEFCPDDECFDEILVKNLRAELQQITGQTLIVMHMIGNHGPAYYKRYPAAFRRFQPDCRTAELGRCTREAVVNSYDNGILYTDHVLAALIDVLGEAADRVAAAMWYVSDHGESLGEGGLYLHGMPYALAPDLQKQVPMIAWASPAFAQGSRFQADCLREQTSRPASHDDLFHTVLGLMNVETQIYRADRDLLQNCRRSLVAAATSPKSVG